jgi:thioesterase domain-containing protein/acyl carrier protein
MSSKQETTVSHDAVLAPRNDVERRLVNIWQTVLDVSPIGIRDDFFDLGGHSLLAARLSAAILEEFGANLPLAVLFDAPTVERMAEILGRKDEPVGWTPLVAIQTGGSRFPLYVISGAGGNVIRFHDLAKYLGSDQPVYALQPPGLDGKQAFLTHVEELAAYFITEIRKVQPHGPYHIVGYSFGGFVAFEMAAQLKAQGEFPGLVGLLDTEDWNYGVRSYKSRPVAERLRAYRSNMHELLFGRDRWNYLKRKIQMRVSAALFAIARAFGQPLPQWCGTIEDINRFAAIHYSPKLYQGRLTLFRAAADRAKTDLELGWGHVATQVEVHEITGQHNEITDEPHVRVLAAKLSRSLEETNLAREKSRHAAPAAEAQGDHSLVGAHLPPH